MLRMLIIRPTKLSDYLYIVGLMVVSFLYLNTGQARADVPYEEQAYHSSMKDIIPPRAVDEWKRKNEAAYYYRERGSYEYSEQRYPKPNRKRKRSRADDGTPLYTINEIERICGTVGEQGISASLYLYDTYYRAYECRAHDGKSWLRRRN